MASFRTGYEGLAPAIQGAFDTYYRRKEGQKSREHDMEKLKMQLDAAKKEGDTQRAFQIQQQINAQEFGTSERVAGEEADIAASTEGFNRQRQLIGEGISAGRQDIATAQGFKTMEQERGHKYDIELEKLRQQGDVDIQEMRQKLAATGLDENKLEILARLYNNALEDWRTNYSVHIPDLINDEIPYDEVKNRLVALGMDASFPIKEDQWKTMSDDNQRAVLTKFMKSELGNRALRFAKTAKLSEGDVKLIFDWSFFPGKIDWDEWAFASEAESILETKRPEEERIPRFQGLPKLTQAYQQYGMTSIPVAGAGLFNKNRNLKGINEAYAQ